MPGSDRLKTRPTGAGPAAEIEALDPSTPGGRTVEGEWLARCVVRDRFVPVLLDVLDRLAFDQEPEEQAIYGHLYRLALGEERNWCRASRRELELRARLSDRRLGKALAGLVAKGHIRLVERDKRGTLYRVMLPHEVFGEGDHDTVHMPRPPKGEQRRASAGTRPAREAKRERRKVRFSDSLSKLSPESVGALAGSFLQHFGERPGRGRAEVVEEILGRLEEGRSLEQVGAELELFGAKAPRSTPLSELARFVERQGTAR